MKQLTVAILLVFFVTSVVSAENNQIPLIGSKAPKFTTNSTNGKITFPNDFGKSWKILFSHPQDFTPVCTSELLELAYMQSTFDKLGVKLAVISTDGVEQHKLWKAHLEGLNYKDRGTFQIYFPILEDTKAVISKQYGMLHEPVSTSKDIRGVFILDGENTVRSINFYPTQVGRNMDELVRIIEALQTTDQANVLTPANWNNGDHLIVPYNPNSYKSTADNSNVKDEYYSVGNQLWFKKIDK